MGNEGMSRTVKIAAYHCGNDCVQSGCPGHTMRLIYENCSDTVVLEIDGEHRWTMDEHGEFMTLLRLAGEVK
jgi:hypothetical protein